MIKVIRKMIAVIIGYEKRNCKEEPLDSETIRIDRFLLNTLIQADTKKMNYFAEMNLGQL